MNQPPHCYHCKKPVSGEEIFCRHCGTRLRDTGLQAGQMIGKHYEVEDIIGQGGMGQVVKARHNLTNQVVAIKTLSPHLAADPGLRERFLQEARALAGLDHPNIMTLYTFLEEEGKFFLVMQYIDGQDVDAMFRRCMGISPRASVPIFQLALKGLGYAHQQGIIHRDLKPANIMVTRDGRVKLTDFGIALIRGGLRLTVTGAQVGTVFYMAPEQIQGSPATPRSDLYAMGVSLFESIAGRLPFEGDDYTVRKGHVEDPAPDIRQFRPDVPENLAKTLLRALAKHPNQRFQTADEFCEALGNWGDVIPLVECPLCGSKHPVGEGVSCPSCGKDELCRIHMVDEYNMCRPCVQLESRTASLHEQPGPPFSSNPQEEAPGSFVYSAAPSLSGSSSDLPYSLHGNKPASSPASASSPSPLAPNNVGYNNQGPGISADLSDKDKTETEPPRPHMAPSTNQRIEQQGSNPRHAPPRLASRPHTSTGATLPPNITTRDRADMVLIPEGYFILGAHDEPNATPPKRCYLRSYYIDRYPVNHASYERFVRETGHPFPSHWWNPNEHQGRLYPPDLTLHPIVNVTYSDAVAYCRWAGKRLPYEAEWEKASRGTDSRLYPWGTEWVDGMAHFGANSTSPSPKYAKAKSPYGVCDLLGNVWEWVADWYAADSYAHMDETSPYGPSQGKYRTIRGGGFSDPPRTVRVTTRNFRPPETGDLTLGFRCVLDP
ncbi:MAG: hypothetical protein EP343_05865 [Deltaproteobacteria bacterium]|nr:MAG: hypothetical protein EP343_05865 [Deltaproteobacteria bacterium]